MRKIVILFSFILLFLFLGNNGAWGAVGDSCTCYFDAWDLIEPCKDPTPPSCGSGETCSCVPKVTGDGIPFDCYPGTCVLKPTPIPPPSTCGQHGTCDPYMTATEGCIAINIYCESGYTPVVSADCSWCCCEASGILPEKCKENTPQEGIMTALGCIPTKEPTQFIAWLLARAIGIGGGIAFLLMLFGAFQILISAGNPEKVQAGKELITSALAGLLLIIFSLFLLEFIGVKILQIPGFGG